LANFAPTQNLPKEEGGLSPSTETAGGWGEDSAS